MHKTKLFLNKPMYTAMTILEYNKMLMYDSFYKSLKAKYGPKCELIYTDIEIETEGAYKDMAEEIEMYDISNYLKDHPLWSEKKNNWER